MEQAGGDLVVDGEEAEVVADGGDLPEFGVNGGLFAEVHCEEIAVAETEAFAFGIGASQLKQVLATQCLWQKTNSACPRL